MKKLLFFCNTLYQILFSVNYLYVRKNIEMSLIITETCGNSKALIDRLVKVNLFKNVYYLNLKNIPKFNKPEQLVYYYKQKYFHNNFMHKYLNINENIDELYFANFNVEVVYLRRMLFERNKHLETYMYEDGFATYSYFYENTLRDILHPSNLIYRVLRKRLYDNYYAVKKLFVFKPEYMMWKSDKFSIEEIQFIGAQNVEFLKVIRSIFGVNNLQDNYHQRYIFFEESYQAEERKINDLELLNALSMKVGKENIFVKTHPRNTNNRFIDAGYITNKDTAIPWEVLALILPLNNKILITVASVSVLTPRVLLGIKYKAYMLYKIVEPQSNLHLDIIPVYENIRQNFNEEIKAPNTLDELYTYMEL